MDSNYEQAYQELLASSLIPISEEVAKELKVLEDEAIWFEGLYCQEYEDAIMSLRNPEIDNILRENRLILEGREEKARLARGASRGRAFVYSLGLTIVGAASLPIVGLGICLMFTSLLLDSNDR